MWFFTNAALTEIDKRDNIKMHLWMRDYEGPKWTDVPDGDVELRVLVPND
jgi:hypothetical protein